MLLITNLHFKLKYFTRALLALLPADSHVTAIDRESQSFNSGGADFINANFERDKLDLSDLDGILMGPLSDQL